MWSVGNMNPSLSNILSITLLLVIHLSHTTNGSQHRRSIKAIEIISYDTDTSITPKSLSDLSANPVVIDVELGESIDNQMIYLVIEEDDKRDYKIEEQYETTMSVSAEGPHMDLIDWKHHLSDWKEIPQIGKHRFLTLKLNESESRMFPKVNQREIYSAVKERVTEDSAWALEKARLCKGPNTFPCYVSVSRVSLRISVKENNKWELVNQIDFHIPMGC
jgi:hypothetical protein